MTFLSWWQLSARAQAQALVEYVMAVHRHIPLCQWPHPEDV